MSTDPYKLLAERLDALPNGFPPTDDGAELRVLAKLFSPEEAMLAAQLRAKLETPAQIAARIGGDADALGKQLKAMARRGLIGAGRAEGGMGYKLLPFVVGFYEMQFSTMDAELARLFEDYYRQAFGKVMNVGLPVHRVIPVNQTVQMDVEVQPYESVAEIIASAKAWGVLDCICRKQQSLLGEPCQHPIQMCMTMSQIPDAFASSPTIHALTREEALAKLRQAAEAGLVHQVSNNQRGLWYICNCCTCSCAMLRGMKDLGLANVVARSAFVNQVDEAQCIGCALCIERCQFDALTMDGKIARVSEARCVGCGVCALVCDQDALYLVRRSADQVLPPPVTEDDWRAERAAARGIKLDAVM
jgi:ferredoxin